ncbi:MAG TPA: cytochrome c oxidase assembly protein [Kiloniellales bacterium]|nr:cytochrome c oxidase assembly protein [Kiloniellales bacterium]
MERPDLLALCLAVLPPVTPQNLWQSWVFAPETLAPLLLLSCLPWVLPAFRRSAGVDRSYWILGCSFLALALVSPLCRLAATLAWAHMVQHLILILLAPLALALGLRPLLAGRRLPASLVSLATLFLGAAIWLSHLPWLYERALQQEILHLALLAGLLGSALLFWLTALSAPALRAMGMVFVTIVHSGLLGALLTFSDRLWYPVFGVGPGLWGLTPMEDQQLAGLIMWVPMGLILAAIGLWLWLNDLLWSDEPARQ